MKKLPTILLLFFSVLLFAEKDGLIPQRQVRGLESQLDSLLLIDNKTQANLDSINAFRLLIDANTAKISYPGDQDLSGLLEKTAFIDSLRANLLTELDSAGFRITEAQISDLTHFTNADETDQIYASDSSGLKQHVRDDLDLDPTNEIQDTTEIAGLAQYIIDHAPASSGIALTDIYATSPLEWNNATGYMRVASGYEIPTDADMTKLDGISANATITNLTPQMTSDYVVIQNSGGNSATLGSATSLLAGILTSSLYDNIISNNAKVSNVSHTGEVVGSTALYISANVINENMLEASNSPTDGYFPSYNSSTGGFTWEAVSSGTTYTAGALLDLSGTTFNVDLSEATSDNTLTSTDELIYISGSTQKRGTAAGLLSYIETNGSFDSEWTSDTNGITYADNVGIGTSSQSGYSLYVSGKLYVTTDAIFSGSGINASGYRVNAAVGISTTFEDNDGNTITVTEGIITAKTAP